jgi:hypothetical protein
MKTKKRNATDLTTRNNDARKREIAELRDRLTVLEARVNYDLCSIEFIFEELKRMTRPSKPKRGRGR